MFYKVLVTLLLVNSVWSVIVNHQNCADGTKNQATDIIVAIDECDDVTICPAVKGRVYTVTVTFVPTINTNGLKQDLSAIKDGVMYHGFTHDVCATVTSVGDVSCESTNGLIRGTTYRHSVEIHVLTIFPEALVRGRMDLYSAENKVLCIEMTFRIVKE